MEKRAQQTRSVRESSFIGKGWEDKAWGKEIGLKKTIRGIYVLAERDFGRCTYSFDVAHSKQNPETCISWEKKEKKIRNMK